MNNIVIHIFGNPDVAMDALPLRLLPDLKKRFPEIEFRVLDPNEEWEIPDPFILVDTVVGIPEVHLFSSLDEFAAAPTVSVHSFDALYELRYLKKLGKLGEVRVIGIPPDAEPDKALETISMIFRVCSKKLINHECQ